MRKLQLVYGYFGRYRVFVRLANRRYGKVNYYLQPILTGRGLLLPAPILEQTLECLPVIGNKTRGSRRAMRQKRRTWAEKSRQTTLDRNGAHDEGKLKKDTAGSSCRVRQIKKRRGGK